MSYSNRDLVVYYINYKLSQKNYSWDQFSLEGRTGGAEAVGSGSPNAEERTNGAANGGGGPVSRQPPQGIEAVQGALRDSANEFELRYGRAFSDLSSQLHITPATAYQSFEHVMDEVFRDGVNWGRIVGLFAFGGALCVECVEKEMSNLVSRIAEWMTVYLDNNIQPWIQSQGGWSRDLGPPRETIFQQPLGRAGEGPVPRCGAADAWALGARRSWERAAGWAVAEQWRQGCLLPGPIDTASHPPPPYLCHPAARFS
nr:PREDICTED: bcl-2-like protein 1 isoform X1 [Lepisosteus oculatus]